MAEVSAARVLWLASSLRFPGIPADLDLAAERQSLDREARNQRPRTAQILLQLERLRLWISAQRGLEIELDLGFWPERSAFDDAVTFREW